ncbi:MAG: hypothetical protein N3E44_03810 [Candidatus Bathyarchaeota archaeon]|nr:hypothetical protein [Candidatus Bathyarchaeota archaeon]
MARVERSLERLREDTRRFVKNIFSKYYSSLASTFIEEPPRISGREFGFNLFDKGIVRHISFKSRDDLLEYLKANSPSDCYYSSAFYMNPSAPMDGKGWIGAELTFDIDADHIHTDCKAEHDRWVCTSCRYEEDGDIPERCPNCGGDKLEERVWFCERCLLAARRETMKLIEILSSEFGVEEDNMTIYFSGHRGFHIHVSGEVEGLDQNSRREIADYLLGVGSDPSVYFERMIAAMDAGGAKLRILRAIYDLLSSASPEDLKAIGLKRSFIESIVEDRDRILGRMLEGGFDRFAREVGLTSIRKLIAKAVEYSSVKIDSVVTLDIHRLIRLPGSLHGKTGLMKSRVGSSLESLEGYDPLSEATPFRDFRDHVKLYVYSAPKFRIEDESYGPFEGEEVSLPLQPALLLLCKGVAYISG